MKIIKDPIHGYIELSEAEARIIDTYAFQRLRRINQLPLVYLVYPGARHSRFDHSLGCLHLAGEFAKHLGLNSYEATLLRSAALLHDVGHTPYSHLLETLLLERGKTHEDVSIDIISKDGELSLAVEESGVSVEDVVNVLRGRHVLSPLISGPLDVDRLDFLVRDAYFTGATYGIIDVRRIIHLTKLGPHGPSVDVKGAGAVEELAIARHHSFMNIYFHHAVRAAQVLLLRGAEILQSDELDLAGMSLEEYLGHDDYTVWHLIKSNPKTGWVISRLERRRLPKRVYEAKLAEPRAVAETLKDKHKLEEEIAHEARIDPMHIYVDSSHAPPLSKFGASGIAMHAEVMDRHVSIDSWIIEMVSRPVQIIRVYVDRDLAEVERVRKVAESVLPPPP